MTILYENKWCRIVNKDTFYILQSKGNKYNDQYFTTSDAAFKAIGIHKPTEDFLKRLTFRGSIN